MNNIKDNLNNLVKSIPSNVTLIAVSKTKPVDDIMKAYDNGQRIFGENKVQEMLSKREALPKDIEWHMIGHLQRNKVGSIMGKTALIHGVDSLRLLEEINKQSNKNDVVTNCLLQVHIASEESKFGFDQEELLQIASSDLEKDFPNVNIQGLMGMATFTSQKEIIEKEFLQLKRHFDRLIEPPYSLQLDTLSMGMSGDYLLAIEAGSTMIRVGSKIFGGRS